ncbi:MAG: hypothetical protein WAN95_10130, partial [Bacteroidales bacterium]
LKRGVAEISSGVMATENTARIAAGVLQRTGERRERKEPLLKRGNKVTLVTMVTRLRVTYFFLGKPFERVLFVAQKILPIYCQYTANKTKKG